MVGQPAYKAADLSQGCAANAHPGRKRGYTHHCHCLHCGGTPAIAPSGRGWGLWGCPPPSTCILAGGYTCTAGSPKTAELQAPACQRISSGCSSPRSWGAVGRCSVTCICASSHSAIGKQSLQGQQACACCACWPHRRGVCAMVCTQGCVPSCLLKQLAAIGACAGSNGLQMVPVCVYVCVVRHTQQSAE